MLSISYLTHIIENGVVLPFIHLSQFSKDVRQRCYVPLTYVVVARKCSGMWNNGQHDLIYIWDPICTSNCVTGACCCGIGNQLDTQIYMATPENSMRDASILCDNALVVLATTSTSATSVTAAALNLC